MYPCKGKDEWCAIAVFNDDEWRAFCEAAGEASWANDSRFDRVKGRKRHEYELDEEIARWCSGFTARDIMTRLQSFGIRAGVVQSVPDLFSCPQLLHRRQWRRLNHPEFESFEHLAPPFLLSETPAELRRSSPCLGEHNEYVFGQIVGLPPDEIERLQNEGVIA